MVQNESGQIIEIEEIIYSPQMKNGSGIFVVNLNFGHNIITIDALHAGTTFHSLGGVELIANEETIVSIARILIRCPANDGNEHLFHVVEHYPVYAGVIGSLSTYDPEESVF